MRSGRKVEGKGTRRTIENDEDHEALRTSLPKDDELIETLSTKARGIFLKIEVPVIDRPEKVLLKSVEKPKAPYHPRPRRSKRTSIPLLP